LGQAHERRDHDCIIDRGAYLRRNNIAATSELCIGCGRTLAEIGGWLSMTADERRRVMDNLPARRAALPRTGTT
jgi:hypothetical protein